MPSSGEVRPEQLAEAERAEFERLAEALIAIGRVDSFLGAERMTVEEIGEKLNKMGGKRLMKAAHRVVANALRNRPGLARELEWAWDGIGEWLG
jgi:hypothetical protein